jgi:hypothetical protein
MTSQGTPHGRFQRAIRARDLWHASMAARELGTVSLGEDGEPVIIIGATATAHAEVRPGSTG